MAGTITRSLYEEGSVRRLGAGYGEASFDLVAAGGTTTVANVKTPFTELLSVRAELKTPNGAVFEWVPNATDPTAFDATFTANSVGKVYARGRGM